MKKKLFSVLAVSTALSGAFWGQGAASAETLQDALIAAYSTNPQLKAQQASLRATDENYASARSGYRPSVTGAYRETVTDKSGESSSMSLTASQNIFRGFGTVSAVSEAKNLVLAGRASLQTVEQNVLLGAATAYMDVFRDKAVLNVTENQIKVLDRQLQASRDRFRVGEITRTDVAQSEARLERAKSSRLQAVAALAASRGRYQRIVGALPAGLDRPGTLPELPANLEEAIELARSNSPTVATARFAEKAAQQSVKRAKSSLLPRVDLNASVSRTGHDGVIAQIPGHFTDKSLTVNMSVPFYTGGVNHSGVRRAKQLRSQRMLEIEQAERIVVENAFVAWDRLRAASAQILSSKAQVRANEIALEGVRQEAAVGSRTTLEVLNADQELQDSRVNLIRAERDEFVAAYGLLAAIGQLTAKELGLEVDYYNPTKYADKVKNKLIGF